MKRRTALKTLLAASPAAVPDAAPAQTRTSAIQLHTDVHVKAESEQALLDDFYKRYLPRIRKAPGFIEAKLLKFRKANIGKAHPHHNYRLVQVFESEALREKWTTAEGHKVAWHEAIEAHLKTPFDAMLFEIAAESKQTKA